MLNQVQHDEWGGEQALRAAFEPAERVGRNEVRPQGETSPSLIKPLFIWKKNITIVKNYFGSGE